MINAGGISYASYRVAHLMQELADYEPDLFIVYTGHNEFLEERTYGKIRDIPATEQSPRRSALPDTPANWSTAPAVHGTRRPSRFSQLFEPFKTLVQSVAGNAKMADLVRRKNIDPGGKGAGVILPAMAVIRESGPSIRRISSKLTISRRHQGKPHDPVNLLLAVSIRIGTFDSARRGRHPTRRFR